jgi:thioredoxin reductase
MSKLHDIAVIGGGKQLGARLAGDGRVVVDEHGETSAPGLFAAGDLVAGKKMQIYTGWDEAVDAADTINRRLRGKRRAASELKKAS